jgi:NADPH:quinone reductase-like Zn-dependent oxidoreductase
MQVVRVAQPGNFDGLVIQQEEVPVLGRRDVLIRVRAASLNYRDMALAKGLYPGATREAPVPLSDGAGDVVAIGPDVTRFKVGDRVTISCFADWVGGRFALDYHFQALGFTLDGTLRDYAQFHENAVVRLPDYLSYEEAAALPCAAVSAWSALTFGEPLTPGQTVLIQGTGGVALFGLQIARMFGARVLAITSSAEKARKLEALGAAAVVNYKESPEWGGEILKLTNGQGVDKVIEIGGESTIQQSINCTRYGGEIGLVGFVTGMGGGLPPIEILKKSVTIKGMAIGPRLSFETMLAAMEVTKVRPVVDSAFPFSDYKAAYRRLESANHFGKVVIKVAES